MPTIDVDAAVGRLLAAERPIIESLAASTDAAEANLREQIRIGDLRIADLAQQLADCQGEDPPPPPPPPARETDFGVSRPDLVPGAPTQPVVRSYLSSRETPTSWDADSGLRRARLYADRGIIVSIKEVAGPWLAALLSTKPANRDVYVCPFHEPMDNFPPTDSRAVAEYHRRFDLAVPIIRDNGCIPVTILHGHPEGMANVAKYERDDVDLDGFDRYNPGIQNPSRYVAPAEVFGPCLEYVRKRGRRTMFAETGTGVVGSDVAGRLKWTRDMVVELDVPEVEAVAWWNMGGCAIDSQLAGILAAPNAA